MICTFCGKGQDDIDILVVGTRVNICNECISLCENIRREHRIYRIWQQALEQSFSEVWGTDV